MKTVKESVFWMCMEPQNMHTDVQKVHICMMQIFHIVIAIRAYIYAHILYNTVESGF